LDRVDPLGSGAIQTIHDELDRTNPVPFEIAARAESSRSKKLAPSLLLRGLRFFLCYVERFASSARDEEKRLMSYYEATDQTPTDDDLWHVQLASGDVCLMTLDQLDDAFQTGVISENTYLWQEGATGWVTLREVAGLDTDEAEDVSAHVQQDNPFEQPSYASESVWPSAPAAPAYNYAAQDPFAPPVQVMGPMSTAPVVSPLRDMDFDLEPVNFGKKRHTGRWLFAAALIGAAGFGAVKYNLVPTSLTSLSNASPVPPSVAAIPLPVETVAAPQTPPPAPVATTPPAPEPAKTISDDVKQRLADADKKLAAKQKAKQQQLQQRHASSGSTRRSSGSGAKGVFSKGGETGDPLNSSL
jgi:hypothetical protein